ncbi:MAG: hypothetical protein ONB11_04890, partial [candidate division KSB1 bacterium]|nr:hypothetical protein [candidate division KSB1 bacterium]
MIHQSLQQLGIQPCPDDVILRVLEILQIDPKSSTKHSFGSRRPGMAVRYRWRWATVALIVIIGAMIVVSPKHGLPPPEAKHYTDAEIQQAKDQVRFTISWLRQVQIQTQKALEDQIFPQQVIKPLRSSLSTALKPLFNGEKR